MIAEWQQQFPNGGCLGDYHQVREACQCHDCTQARWRQSIQYQFYVAEQTAKRMEESK